MTPSNLKILSFSCMCGVLKFNPSVCISQSTEFVAIKRVFYSKQRTFWSQRSNDSTYTFWKQYIRDL